jgi:hypothetical protein
MKVEEAVTKIAGLVKEMVESHTFEDAFQDLEEDIIMGVYHVDPDFIDFSPWEDAEARVEGILLPLALIMVARDYTAEYEARYARGKVRSGG